MWGPMAEAWPSLVHSHLSQPAFIVAEIAVILVGFNYTYILFSYHWSRKRGNHESYMLPPQYPFFIPFVGALVPLAWDSNRLLRRVTCAPNKNKDRRPLYD